MSALPFTKMHGLGNDFVILDGRSRSLRLNGGAARAISDRKRGIGCDQLIVLEPPRRDPADVFMRILTADGSESAACGNATRCVAHMVMAETGKSESHVETAHDILEAERETDGRISVDMGRVRFDWRDVPLSEARDTGHLDITIGGLSDPARSASATLIAFSSSITWRRSISRPLVARSSAWRCSPNAPMSSSFKSSTPKPSANVFGSGASA